MKVRKGKAARRTTALNLQSALGEIEAFNIDALHARWTMWLGGEPTITRLVVKRG